ncbi:hypothetical protein D9M71_796880 [compost metagenome]
MILRIIVTTTTINPPHIVTVKAFKIVSVTILRLKRTTSSFPRICDHIVATKTAKVVILIPPAVDPEPAPINMKRIIKNNVECVKSPIASVLEPAVRGVTAW